MTLRQTLLKLASKDIRVRRVLQRELRRTANLPNATVGMFIEVLSSKLTQWDKRYNKANPHALAHYFGAVQKLRDFLGQDLKSQDPEALVRLKKALLSERFLFKDFGPVKATVKQIDQFLVQGTMPSLTRRASQRDLAWWQGESGKWYVQKGGGWDKEDLYFYPTQAQKNGGVKGLLKNDLKSGQAKQISLSKMDFSAWIEIPEASVPEHVKMKINTRKTATRRGIIGPGGLGPLQSGITLQPNTLYWIGASSSPTMIIVTNVTDKAIEYFDPYRKTPMRVERWIGEDLITKGSKRWLATYGQVPGWKTYAKSIASMLSGGPGKKEKLSDWERVRVTVKRKPAFRGEDLWRVAERYGNVAGIEDADGDQLYEIEGFRRSVMEVKKDPHFVVVGAKKLASRIGPGDEYEDARSRLRIERTSTSATIRVTDLTYAGKRGKKVGVFAVYDLGFADALAVDRLADLLMKAGGYAEALSVARSWVEYYTDAGIDLAPKLEVSDKRGVDVKPMGFKPIKIETPHVIIEAKHDDWRVVGKKDTHNVPVCIAQGKASVGQFFRWIQDNRRGVETMTFGEIVRALDAAGIKNRQFCGVN